jgi:hypothetical protein
MTHEQILELMDIEIVRCEPAEWGGSYGYAPKGGKYHGKYQINGYKTEKQLINSVIKQKFGNDKLGKLCLKLLLAHKNNKK